MKLSPNQRQALELIAAGRFFPALVREDDGWHARWLPDVPWLDEYVRSAAVTPLTADAEDHRHATLHDAWIAALRSRTGLVRWDDAECAAFAETLREWTDAESVTARGGITFTLATEGDRLFVSCPVPRGRAALRALGESVYEWGKLRELKSANGELRVELTRNEAEDFVRRGAAALESAGYRVVRGAFAARVTAAAEIRDDQASATAHGSLLTDQCSLTVKVDGKPVSAEEIRFLLEQKSNFVFFRDHWIEIDRSILREALNALEKVKREKVNAVAFALGIGAIGRLEIDEAKVSGEISRMINELRAAEGLEGERAEGQKGERAEGQKGERADGLKGERADGLKGEGADGLKGEGADGLKGEGADGLKGSLRDYQARGVRWMKAVTGRGFGALLADDMGLGKTIQTIAWILGLMGKGAEGQKGSLSPSSSHALMPSCPHALSPSSSHALMPSCPHALMPSCPHALSPSSFLIVAPLTLLANWRHEFGKFAPSLRVYVHQGEGRHLASGFRKACTDADVVITSYNLLVREHVLFREVAWDGLVLDEAQAIKNFDTHTARAVRALMPRYRVALTGTPIENTVEDIWSIEEFLNPGFLGERKEFEERFVKPLAQDPMCRAGKRLRKALEPFVLRRLKSDPEIAVELGGKMEIREYCQLTDVQRADYERALGDYRMSVRKQGDVFALITALKLVCDGRGKLDRLVELLTQIFAAGESALVFTQYAKIGSWLKKELDNHFHDDVPFLHGALSASAREREIRAFNQGGPKVFLLSLRAGGFGLNLTKATHVIHFDRWWNPAVEGQATDRAHRIGQERDVFVHEFITVGTLEERIDEILARKQTLEGLLKDGEELWKAVKLG